MVRDYLSVKGRNRGMQGNEGGGSKAEDKGDKGLRKEREKARKDE